MTWVFVLGLVIGYLAAPTVGVERLGGGMLTWIVWVGPPWPFVRARRGPRVQRE